MRKLYDILTWILFHILPETLYKFPPLRRYRTWRRRHLIREHKEFWQEWHATIATVSQSFSGLGEQVERTNAALD